MTHPPRTHRQFLTNISHLTQTFPEALLFCAAVNMLSTQTRWRVASVSCVPGVSIKNYSRTPTRDRYRSLDEEEQRKERISLRGTLELICVRLSQQPGWLTSDTIKWKQEGTEDHHYINHQSFPRIPSSIICTHHLMGFVCSETNFSVNITVTSLPLTLAQSHGDRKTKDRGKTQEEMKINRTEVLAFVT